MKNLISNCLMVEKAASFRDIYLGEIAQAIGCDMMDAKRFAKVVLRDFSEEDYVSGSQVVQFVYRSFSSLPAWLVEFSDDGVKRYRERLKMFRAFCLYLIEESDFMSDLSDDDLTCCRTEMSSMLDVVDDFLKAEKLMEPGCYCNPESYVEKLMTKMQKTGYIYKVEDVFRVMIALFKIMPRLMNEKMSQLMDIMLHADVKRWQEESLRVQLIKLLEHFVQTNKPVVDSIADFENKQEQDLLVAMIKALSMQLFLYEPADGVDYNLNRSVLYRYASHTRIALNSTDKLLSKSYHCLIGSIDSRTRLEYTWENIRNIDVLVSLLQSRLDLKDVMPVEYVSAASRITFGSNGVDLEEAVADNSQSRVVAGGIVPWQGLRIHLASEPSSKVNSNTTDVEKLGRWWKEVESILTKDKDCPFKQSEKHKPFVGEDVNIVFDGVEDADKGLFRCHIKSDTVEGRGVIAVHEIVSFKIRPEVMNEVAAKAFFTEETGRQALYEATVLNEKDGMYEFSMKKRLNDYIIGIPEIGFGYKTSCVVTSLNIPGQVAVGVSRDGIPVILPYSDSMQLGDCYKVVVEQVKANKHCVQLLCEIDGEEHEAVTQDKAFISLMLEYGLADEEPVEAVRVLPQRVLSMAYAAEIIRLIDRESLLLVDVHCRYNYLQASKVLAHIIGDGELVAYYENRLALQKLLYDFSKSNMIDREQLTRLDSLDAKIKSQYPILGVRIKELKVLECLDKFDSNAQLFADLQCESNTELKRLINLVLAYNHLAGFGLQEQRNAIIKQINDLLHVTIQVQESHYFGEENDQQEFKSSVVYVANSEGRHLANIEEQTKVILKEICAFLNTKGGTLYLGVNDYGYAQGLDVDLQWFQQHKFWHVSDMDDYRQYVVNMLCRRWPSLKDVFDVTFPNIKGHAAIAIKVPPCKSPVALDGEYYCRVGSECRKITEEGLAGFLERRALAYEQMELCSHAGVCVKNL